MGMRSNKKVVAWVAAGLVLVLVVVTAVGLGLWRLLGGSFQQAGSEPAQPLPEVTPVVGDVAVDPAYAAFYQQELKWWSCFETQQCTSVKVPMDWANPAGESIEISVTKAAAKGQRQGAILINPGGPGASGLEFVGQNADFVVSKQVRQVYDVVGFDPRGVGRSAPVNCVPDSKLDGFLFDDSDPETPAGLAKSREAAKEFSSGCVALTGPVLAHVDTVSAARDMDVIRAVLGDDRLTYLGKSYGTLLGATYAGLYPQRVGRLVLDGAIDPTLTSVELSLEQAKGIESAYRAYLEWCLKGKDCPFTGSVDDAMKRTKEFLDSLEEQQLPMGDDPRKLTPHRAMIGIVTPLYDNRAWPSLSGAFRSAFAGDGSTFGGLADQYADRRSNGTYGSNLMEAFSAVNCLDYAVDDSDEAIAAAAQRIQAAAPVFGRYMSYGETLCGAWPHPVKRTAEPITAKGAPAILVVGTTNDMATPYRWSEALAKQLDSGRLLTFEGEGHTAYMRGSRCIDKAVDGFLVKNQVPVDGARCSK